MKKFIEQLQSYQKRRLLEGSLQEISPWGEFTLFFLDYSMPALISACATQLNLEHVGADPFTEEEISSFTPNLPFFENKIEKEMPTFTSLLEGLRHEIRKQKAVLA